MANKMSFSVSATDVSVSPNNGYSVNLSFDADKDDVLDHFSAEEAFNYYDSDLQEMVLINISDDDLIKECQSRGIELKGE